MNARDWALIRLDAKQLPGWEAHLLPKRFSGSEPTDERDLALAEKIEIGVVKSLLHLQFLIEAHAHRPLTKIDVLAQKILAIALYQLKYLERIPPHAAVNAAVEQTRRAGRTSASGFVNAVLRNALRETPPAAPREIELSHPKDLLGRLIALYGEEKAMSIAKQNNSEPPTIVRALKNVLTEVSTPVAVVAHEQDRMFVLENARRSILADLSARGIAQVQDPTAALVVPHLGIQPGQRILDRCCGMGTKTIQILELLNSTGHVTAVDPNPMRCAALIDIANKRGFTNLTIHQLDRVSPLTQTFECILIDVPCSNSGVMSRRPEARYHQDPASMNSIADLQRMILADTAPWLAPNGKMIYSTCSIWPEENESRVREFLQQHPDYHLISETATAPSGDVDKTKYHDGGYFAVLQRRPS